MSSCSQATFQQLCACASQIIQDLLVRAISDHHHLRTLEVKLFDQGGLKFMVKTQHTMNLHLNNALFVGLRQEAGHHRARHPDDPSDFCLAFLFQIIHLGHVG